MTKRTQRNSATFNRKLMSVAVASCFVADLVFANPTAPLVVHGTANIHQAGNLLQVTNSPSAIINWGSFSINANEITRFIQQSASSAVLNRVVGQDPSAILGALQSNGRVFLINPNGILFGAGAQINVAGLVASTLNLSDADFLNGRMRFTEMPGAGGVVNQGAITGGSVYLVAPDITNSGIITSPKGEVILAAGKSVELVNPATPNLRVEIVASENEARNLGQIVADSGRIGIYAGLINHGGTLRADTVEVGKNGEILLKANKNIVLDSGSVISASGVPGGVHDGGTVRIVAEDTLDMRRGSAVHVDGGVDGGNGGFLELSGKQQIALNGEFTGRARKEGYRHGSLLLDPLNINIGAIGLAATISLASNPGFVLIKQDGTRVYVVRPSQTAFGSDYIEVVDTATNAIVATIDLQDFSNANVYGMALSPDGSSLYAVFGNTGSNQGFIKVVDTTTNQIAGTYYVNGPTNLFAPAVDSNNRIYVAGNVPFSNPSAAEMVVLDGATGSALASVPVAFNPQQIAVNPSSSRVYVISTYPAVVLQEFATGTNQLLGSTVLAARPNSQTISADGSLLYLSYPGKIEVRSTTSMAVVDTIPFGADSIVLNGNTAYIRAGGNASVLDLTTKTVRQSFAVGSNSISGLTFNSGTGRIYAAAGTINQLAVIDLNPGSDAISGGLVGNADSPGTTLNLPVSALSGAWSNVSLAATNNITVNSPLADSNVPAGGALTLTAGNDVSINAWIGEPATRFNHDLSLIAGNNVNVNGSIFLGNNALVLAADANIPAQGITPNGIGNVNIKAPGSPVVVDTLGSMTVSGQDFNILGGNNSSTTVNVGGLFDANLAGNFTLKGGAASAGIGENVNASAVLQAGAINIVAAGTITVAGGDNAEASGCCVGDNGVMGGTGVASAVSDALMTAGASISMSGSSIVIRGGDNATASACCNGMSGGTGNGAANLSANATVTAGTTIALTAPTILIRGGDFAEASACCNGSGGAGAGTGSATLNANASVTSGGNLTINTTNLTVRGGDGGSAYACCNGSSGGVGAGVAVNNTNATVAAGQDIIINATGSIAIAGGNGNSASACCNGASGNGTANVSRSSSALVSAGRHVSITGASLTVRGGDNNSASACCNGSSAGNGTATVANSSKGTLVAGQDMTLTVSGPVVIRGGDNAEASACCNGDSGGVGNVNVNTDVRTTVTAGGTLTLNAASLLVRGGNTASASACCNGSSGGNGTVTVAANASALLQTPQNMVLNVTGPVTISGGDNAEAYACCNGSGVASTATVGVAVDSSATVSAGGALSLTAGSLTVRGGDFASGTACCNGSSGGNGVASVSINTSALLSAGPSLTVNTGAMTVRGGNSSEISASENGGLNSAGNITHAANAVVSATGNIAVTASSLTISGGAGTIATASSNANAGTAVSNANAALTAGQAMNLGVSGPIIVAGGDNANANAEDGGQNTATVMANALVSAGTTLTVTNATNLTVRGGMQGSIYAADANGAGQNAATTQANASIWAMDFSYTGGPVSLLGGIARTRGGTGTNTAVAEASASVMGGGSKLFNIIGDLVISGGQALDNVALPNLGGATARAILDPGALDIAASGDVALTGGTVTGVGSAYSTMMATGPINITVGGSTGLTMTGGSGGTGLSADPSSPITVTYTGGGTTNIVPDPLREGASVQTALFVPPPPPPPLPPIVEEVAAELEVANQVLITSVNESGNSMVMQQSAGAEEPIDPVEKKKEKTKMVCR